MSFYLHHCYRTGYGVARITVVDFAGQYEANHLMTHGDVKLVLHDADGKAIRPDSRGYDLGRQVWPEPRP